jgi:hypothetical protein
MIVENFNFALRENHENLYMGYIRILSLELWFLVDESSPSNGSRQRDREPRSYESFGEANGLRASSSWHCARKVAETELVRG